MEGSDYIKNTKSKLVLVGIIFFIMMNISGIYALTNQATNGSLSTGVVDIKIQTYKLNDGNEEIYSNVKKVHPGEVVSFIPKIENFGEKCYVRVKIKYIDDTINLDDYITNFSNSLEKHGEYYYYNKVLNPEEKLQLFDTIKIPDNISNEDNSEIPLEIIAEAVQEKNFIPDYSKENPWGDIIPEKRIDNTVNINTNKEKSKITIKYESGIDSNINVPNNFLENISKVMPGDNFKEYVEINNDKKNAKYYMQIIIDEKYLLEKELLSKIKLHITNKNGQVIFDGNIGNTGRVLLGNYNINENDRFEFNISVPFDIGNEYTTLNPVLDIVFSAEYDDIPNGQPNSGSVSKNENSISKYVQNLLTNPKTGDKIDWAITMFFISSIGLIITIILGYREKKKEDIDSIN